MCVHARRKNLGIWNNSRAPGKPGILGFFGGVQKQGFLGVFGWVVFFEVFDGVRFFFCGEKKSLVCVWWNFFLCVSENFFL